MQEKNIISFINFLKLFRNISATDEAIIADNLQTRNVNEYEILLQQGKTAKELFFICKGVLKIVSVNEKGKDVTQFFLKENQFCTVLNSFNNNVPANESIVAACNTELVLFSKEKLLQVYKAIPYFKESIHSITQQALLDKIAIRNSYLGEDAQTRYQKFILQQPEIALRVSLSDIASYLGITQQSLSRIRKNMR
ncbi:MAG: Crp/Fnr family transcriptional regulator [Arachidicoccus sp.]|nr:Crp/Fnr family transcriptional regulator [Arachidicoccus sp.]